MFVLIYITLHSYLIYLLVTYKHAPLMGLEPLVAAKMRTYLWQISLCYKQLLWYGFSLRRDLLTALQADDLNGLNKGLPFYYQTTLLLVTHQMLKIHFAWFVATRE